MLTYFYSRWLDLAIYQKYIGLLWIIFVLNLHVYIIWNIRLKKTRNIRGEKYLRQHSSREPCENFLLVNKSCFTDEGYFHTIVDNWSNLNQALKLHPWLGLKNYKGQKYNVLVKFNLVYIGGNDSICLEDKE